MIVLKDLGLMISIDIYGALHNIRVTLMPKLAPQSLQPFILRRRKDSRTKFD